MSPSLDLLLSEVLAADASDAHIAADGRVFLRIEGVLEQRTEPVPPQVLVELEQMMKPANREKLHALGDTDIGLSHNGVRFRINLFRQHRGLAAAIRRLPEVIPTMDEIGLPKVIQSWTAHQTGLVIITGPTGSGKTTTLASIANAIHQNQVRNILTIEDPVEFHFPVGKSRILHREVGNDVSDFPRAVRAGLREDVDVMIIGEMRDSETIEAALSVAETGHLVFATLHTHNAAQAVDRLVDAFPLEGQELTRSRLASCLLGVVYQRLLPAKSGGRVAAFEVLVANQAVRALIRDAKTYQIPNIMESARSEGMQPMVRGLEKLADAGKIDWETVNVYFRRNI